MMVAHELMREPDQRVLKYVAMRPRIFNLSGFRDRCNVDGAAGPPSAGARRTPTRLTCRRRRWSSPCGGPQACRTLPSWTATPSFWKNGCAASNATLSRCAAPSP